MADFVSGSGGASIREGRGVRAWVRWAYRALRLGFFAGMRRLSPAWSRLGPPRGTFSAYDALRQGCLTGQVIQTEQTLPGIGPNSLRAIARLGQGGHQPWPIFWTRHREARLVGRTALLLDADKHACVEAMFWQHQDGDPAYHGLALPAEVRLSGNWTSVISLWPLRPNYYHWMLDCLPRLALLDRMPANTQVLVPDGLRSYQETTLDWLGLRERVRPLREKHLVAENFYFSSPTAMTGCANPYAVRFLREKFLPFADASPPAAEKIYIQRRGRTRGIANEPEVMKLLAGRGWTVVDLEALTVAQQIKLFAGARAVCGAHGAGFANLLWCQPGCVAIELCAANFLNGCYEALAECVAVDHRFLIQEADKDARIVVQLDRLVPLLPD